MKNIFRFFLGLAIFFLTLGLGLIAIIILSPLLLAGFITGVVILAIVLIFLGIVFFISFIWSMSRKEEDNSKNKSYSIKQGKEVK